VDLIVAGAALKTNNNFEAGIVMRGVRVGTMGIDKDTGSIGAVRRKLQAVTAMVRDRGVTEHERANAAALRTRLEQRLRNAGAPAGDWTDEIFRLGKWAKDVRKSTSPVSPQGNWTDHALRFGKALRRGYKKLLSE
jgi:hypothetical protein